MLEMMIYYKRTVIAATDRINQIALSPLQGGPMSHSRSYTLLLIFSLMTVLTAQELVLSTAAKTYSSDEKIWVNLSVLKAAALPGAYTIGIGYDETKLTFQNILPADNGPFTVTPAAAAKNGIITIAGFQGIADTGLGTASLATLVFASAAGPVTIDTASFTVDKNEVFSTQAEEMHLPVVKQSTSVLQPFSKQRLQQHITLTNGYLRFTVLNDGLTSVRIFDLGGRTVAIPLRQSHCKAGNQAVPIGTSLGSGVYIVTVRGVSLNAVKRLEVVK